MAVKFCSSKKKKYALYFIKMLFLLKQTGLHGEVAGFEL